MKLGRWVLLAAFSVLLGAQEVPGRYIVVLDAPTVSKGAAQARAAQVAGRARVAAAGGLVRGEITVTANALIAELSEAGAAALRGAPGVKAVTRDRVMKLSMDAAPAALLAENAWRNFGGAERAGLGIKIGVIDSGIDASHAAFQDDTLPALAGYPKADRESHKAFTSKKVIVARSYPELYSREADFDISPNDADGHGTLVSMAAAGVVHDSPRGKVSGMAPKAYLGNYHVDGPNGQILASAVYKAFDDAVSDGMDVINLSLGSVLTVLPELDQPYADMVADATARGIVVVAAAGNSGPGAMTIDDTAMQPMVIGVGASRHARALVSTVIAGSSQLTALRGSRTAETLADLTAPLADVTSADATSEACTGLGAARFTGRILLIRRGGCVFDTKVQNAAAAGASGVILYMATPDAPFSPSLTMGNTPVLMVSAADGLLLRGLAASGASVTMRFAQRSVAQNHRVLTGFSSRGPALDYGIKPDLTTIGADVYSASTGGGYEAANGTSFASPMVAGTVAFLKSARPGLSVAQYRSMVINSAQWMEETLQQRGNGALNVDEAANATLLANPTSVSFGVSGVNADAARQFTISNLSTAVDTFSITPFALTAGPAATVSDALVTLRPGESRTITARFAANGLPGGERNGLFIVRGQASGKQIFVPYWHGVPTNAAAAIAVLDFPDSVRVNERAEIYFRITDAAGMAAYGQRATVEVSGGAGGRFLEDANFDDESPGLGGVAVRVRSTPGVFTVTIKVAGAPDAVVNLNVTQ